MAICKHTSSKNSSYQSVMDYLEYEHDEDNKTGHYEPIRNENGEMIKRENCELMYVNSSGDLDDPQCWVRDCHATNLKHHQNMAETDRKNHMYILSFDPKDSDKLDMEKLKEIGEKFARENFKGYQCLIAVHMDKDHYHIHFVINSCRDRAREQQPFMALTKTGEVKASEMKEGCKHVHGPKLTRWMNDKALEISKQYGLSDKDMNKQHDKNVAERMDKKDKMRMDLLQIASRSNDMADFKKNLQDAGIELRVRGNTVSVKRADEKKATRLPKLGLSPADLTNSIGRSLEENMSLASRIKSADQIRDKQIAEAKAPAKSNKMVREVLDRGVQIDRATAIRLMEQLEKDIKAGKTVNTVQLEALKKLAPVNTAAQIAEMVRLAQQMAMGKKKTKNKEYER